MNEPTATARLVLAFAVLAGAAVVLGKVSERIRVPVMLVFLAVGMLAGSEGIVRLAFEDYGLSFRVGTLALVLILFDGGLNTSVAALRRFAAPACTLASVGVVGTAALTGLAGHTPRSRLASRVAPRLGHLLDGRCRGVRSLAWYGHSTEAARRGHAGSRIGIQ